MHDVPELSHAFCLLFLNKKNRLYKAKNLMNERIHRDENNSDILGYFVLI